MYKQHLVFAPWSSLLHVRIATRYEHGERCGRSPGKVKPRMLWTPCRLVRCAGLGGERWQERGAAGGCGEAGLGGERCRAGWQSAGAAGPGCAGSQHGHSPALGLHPSRQASGEWLSRKRRRTCAGLPTLLALLPPPRGKGCCPSRRDKEMWGMMDKRRGGKWCHLSP